MAETAIWLTLKWVHRFQFFAHFLMYLYSLTLNPLAPRHQKSREIIRNMSNRFYESCLDESEEVAFWLSPKEAQLVRYVLIQLKPIYQQWPNAPATPGAVEGLSVCLLVLDKAEEQASTKRESR